MVVNATSIDIKSQVDVVVDSMVEKSAFASATPSGNLPVGETGGIITLDTVAGGWVQEGGTKPAGGSASKLEWKASKFAYVTVFTEEGEQVVPRLADALQVDLPRQGAELFDKTIAGEEPSPSVLFHTLANAPEVDVSTGTYAALNAVLGDLPRDASAWVLSKRLYRSLTGITTTTGAPLLDANSKTLLGLPVYTYTSNLFNGFVGDFDGSARHSITLRDTIRRAVDGIVVDVQGVEHNLTQENKIAYISEGYYAFAAKNVAQNFRQLVWGDTPEA